MALSSRIEDMIRRLRWAALCVLVCTAFFTAGLLAQEDTGLLCVAPGAEQFSCASGNVTLKVDARKPVPWPKKKSMSLTGFDLGASHRVVLLCDGKPKESFKFRFSELPFERAAAKKDKACLYVNDLHGWVQLMPLEKLTSWCSCKQ